VAPTPPSPLEIEAYRFYSDWAETARVRIRRRDQLILLGLAKRRRAKHADAAGEDAVDVPEVAAPE
jgi:hypothetical protein